MRDYSRIRSNTTTGAKSSQSIWETDSSQTSGLTTSSTHKRRGTFGERTKYKWETNWDFIIVTVAAIVTIDSFDKQVMKSEHNDPTLLHYITCYVVLGMPVLYMEILLGQYTQLGPTQLKYLSPISHGLGFLMLVTVMLKCIKHGLFMADCLMFFLISFQPQLQWLICPREKEDVCWGQRDLERCKKDCIGEDIHLSTFVYWRDVYMNSPDLSDGYVGYGPPHVARCVTLLFSWFCSYVIAVFGISKYKKLIKTNSIVILSFIVILLMVIMFASGADEGVSLIFKGDITSFFDSFAWGKALSDVIELLGLGRALHIMNGSFLTSSFPTGVLTTGSLVITYAASFMCTLITYGSIGVIVRAASYSGDNPMEIVEKAEKVPALFTIVPQGLGFIGAAQLWSMFYFLVCLLILVNNQMIYILVMDKCISDTFSQLVRYKKYLIGTLCIIFNIVDVFLSSGEIYNIQRHVTTRIGRIIETLNTLLLVVFVFYVYGVQRLTDDIQFMTGSKPTKYWTICWYCSPWLILIPTSYQFYFHPLPTNPTFRLIHWLTILAFVSPLPLMLGVEIFRHLRRHNLAGILQAHERWGPSDPEERHLRHTFNPRQELKSRRRVDVCQHSCLMDSRYLRRFVAEERNLREEREEQLEMEGDDLRASRDVMDGEDSSLIIDE